MSDERGTASGARLALPPRVRPANPHLFILLLAALSTIAPLSTDMYMPAMPSMAQAMGGDTGAIQLSMSSFFVGFGTGQLVWGPLGDRFGRRRPMVVGILLYTLASIACARVDHGAALIAWRFVQAFGGCASPVLAQAMVRDVYERDEGARTLSMMQLVGAIAPMAAPFIGGLVVVWLDWRAVFWILAAFGVVSLIGLSVMPETHPPGRRPRLSPGQLVTGYGLLLADRRYLGYVVCAGFYSGGFFGYLSGVAFVYIQYFGVPPQDFGFLFGVNVIGMMLGNMANRRLVLRHGSDRLLRWGCLAAAAVGAAVVAVAWSGIGGLPALAAGLFCYISISGFVSANAAAGAMANFPHRAGTAAALMGTLRFGFGAVAGMLIGQMASGTPLPMALVIGGFGLGAFATNRWLVRPEPAAP